MNESASIDKETIVDNLVREILDTIPANEPSSVYQKLNDIPNDLQEKILNNKDIQQKFPGIGMAE